ncbi:hypothetical protein JCM10213_001620 [Rhodosporidiobolus nylandii]
MPILHSKKQRTYGTSSPKQPSPQSKPPSPRPLALSSLPKEALSLVVGFLDAPEEDEDPDVESCLAAVSLVSRLFRSLALPLLFRRVQLDDKTSVVRAVKLFKPVGTAGGKGRKSVVEGELGEGPLAAVRELEVSLSTLFDSPPSKATLCASLATLLSLTSSLTSFVLTLPRPTTCLTHLFPSFPAPLTSLTSLRSFSLVGGGEVWLHDLVPLFDAWDSLKDLEIASLRGDCCTPLDVWASKPAMEKLVIRSSTLTGEMIAWLLEGQTQLRWLEMPLPGGQGKAWEAVEKAVKGVEVLKVWDRWAGTTTAKRGHRKKAAVEDKTKQEEGEVESEGEADCESDVDESPPSPLLHLVNKAASLRVVYLTTAMLPSAPSPESFDTLLEHLPSLEELVIEDTPASGLRVAVQAALKEGRLGALEKLVSVGMKKKKGAAAGEAKKGKAPKRFEAICKEHGVEWEVHES